MQPYLEHTSYAFLGSQVDQNNRPQQPEVAHNLVELAHNYKPVAFLAWELFGAIYPSICICKYIHMEIFLLLSLSLSLSVSLPIYKHIYIYIYMCILRVRFLGGHRSQLLISQGLRRLLPEQRKHVSFTFGIASSSRSSRIWQTPKSWKTDVQFDASCWFSSFFSSGLEDGHVPTFWLLLERSFVIFISVADLQTHLSDSACLWACHNS